MRRDSRHIYNRKTADRSYRYLSSTATSNVNFNQIPSFTITPDSDNVDIRAREMPLFSDEHLWFQVGAGDPILTGLAPPSILGVSHTSSAASSGALDQGWHHFPADEGWADYSTAPGVSMWSELGGYGDKDSLYEYEAWKVASSVIFSFNPTAGAHNGITTSPISITGSPSTDYYAKVVVGSLSGLKNRIHIRVKNPYAAGYALDEEYIIPKMISQSVEEGGGWHTLIYPFTYSGGNGSAKLEVLFDGINSAGAVLAVDCMNIYSCIKKTTFEVSHNTFDNLPGVGGYVLLGSTSQLDSISKKPWTLPLDYNDDLTGKNPSTTLRNAMWGGPVTQQCYIGQITAIAGSSPYTVTVAVGAIPMKGDYYKNKYRKNSVPWQGWGTKIADANTILYFYDLSWWKRHNGFVKVSVMGSNDVNLSIFQYDDVSEGLQDLVSVSAAGEYWENFNVPGAVTSLDDWALTHGEEILGRLKAIRLSTADNAGTPGILRIFSAPDHEKDELR